MQKNVAGQKIGGQMVSATDGSAFTGAVTVYVTGDAGVQAIGSVGAGVCTHEGNGYHTYAPAQAETNYDLIAFTFIGTGAVPGTVQVYPSTPQTGDSFARLGAPAGASVSADVLVLDNLVDDLETRLTVARAGYLDNINNATLAAAVFPTDPADQSLVIAATDAIIADTNDIQARLPAALTAAGHMKSDALALDGSTAAAVDLKTSALTIVRAAAIAGTLSTTQMSTDLTEATDDHYNGRRLLWTSGVLIDQATAITDYTGLTKVLTYTAITEAPTAGDTFVIV